MSELESGKPTHVRLVPEELRFSPTAHSLALRQAVGEMLRRANVSSLQAGSQWSLVLENQRAMMLTLAHLCDAVLGMQGEPREIRFERRDT